MALRALRRAVRSFEEVIQNHQLLGSPHRTPRERVRRALDEAESQGRLLARGIQAQRGSRATPLEAGRSFARRLAALLAWIDQEHRFSEDAVPGETPFFVDAVHLDAFAETMDATDWRTVARPHGRAYYADLARAVMRELQTPETPQHVDEVRTLRRSWDA